MAEPQNEADSWYDDRRAALESIFGKAHHMVGHASTPFFAGAESGGAADVFYFRHHVPGIVAVTFELIGHADQKPNELGAYELAICQRDGVGWGERIIGRLAYYTLERCLQPRETMSIGKATPAGSTISAFLFDEFGRFTIRGRPAGVLLCLGITSDELAACREGRRMEVIQALKSSGVYPFTDLNRGSVLAPR